MRRMKGAGGLGGSDMTGNMSYTNLAALASEFENSPSSMLPISAGASGSGGGSSEAMYQKAMELIQMGLKLDVNNPVQACENYRTGAELLSQALDAAEPGPQADEMQRTLDMVEDRVRFVTREAVSRSPSESSLTSSQPVQPPSPLIVDEAVATAFLSEPRASNYFDFARPEELNKELREALQLTSGLFEQLTREFGFQPESAHNQQEHLVMLLANSATHSTAASGTTADGLAVLHSKLLSNYKGWVLQLGATPQCSGEADVPKNKATDLVLLMLIWGEAANLKHVPESLCFLFHKMRQEMWRRSAAAATAPKRPHGWFLNRVIGPLYRHMRTEMSRKDKQGQPLGHTNKCNYDDFNEFFWNQGCLKYSYYVADDADDASGEKTLVGQAGLLRDTFGGDGALSPVSTLPAVKRYVERRSWLHPIRSFWRIHSFLILVLHVLLAFAFCQTRTGLYFDASLVQALCGVVVTHALLGVLRELLALFAMHNMLHTHLAILGSLVLRLTLKTTFLVLLWGSYSQLVTSAPFDSLISVPIQAWAQSTLYPNKTFCYAAGVYAVPAALSALAQVFPALSTWVRSWRGPLKAAVDLFEPLNALYVGKAIHTNCSTKLSYDFFWISLLMLKLAFSYAFQIAPLVEPSRDLWQLDLSSWAPGTDLGKAPNLLVLVVRWTPLMIMYMIDLQLWFMLWTAMYGTVLGCKLHIGEVPDLPTVRDRLLSAAVNFNCKVLSDACGLERATEKAYPQPAFAGASLAAAARDGMKLSSLQASLLPPGSADESGEIRNESLRYFAEAWNAVLEDMRLSDLLSNAELSLLVFRCWHSGTGTLFSRCTYLPIFLTAGKLNESFHLARAAAAEAEGQSTKRRQALELSLHNEVSATFEMREALTEFIELAQWLVGGLLGARHAPSVTKVLSSLQQLIEQGELLAALSPAGLPALASSIVALAQATKAVPLPTKAVPSAGEGGGAAPKRQDSGGLQGWKRAATAAEAGGLLPEGFNAGKVIEKLKAALDALQKCIPKAPKAVVQELEGIKFTSSGLFWDDGYAREAIAKLRAEEQCVEKLDGIVSLCTTAAVDTMPEEFEVKRRLCWFVGSLFMDMPRPPPVSRMHSWTTLTPFYSEDLLYSAKELAAKTEDGVSMLYFLKTVHEAEWFNFLERVGVGRTAAEESRLFTEKALLEELRLWASFRGQTLARTAEGMLLHERALRLLASWEGLRDQKAVEDTVMLKFQYVISCQAYGNHKKARDVKAADTEFLLQRYPSLRVAYVDKASTLTKVPAGPGGKGPQLKEAIRFYSVLIKGVHKDGGEAAVQEVFRVQLPGDIMLGEGKPENQNHAMIFTRGEALQTIDMNQCGYFEEALKMRNLMCEFRNYGRYPQPPTIIGFREHIFTGTSKQLSSLASYMALQEGCFVTLTQRVLWKPLQVRLHYGHPDVFDKVFSMTRGGVSKASRGINLSEDIYAGFNHLLRGCTIPYIEYVQVGKGRDVGMQQIYKFEAKLASGNAEQCLSRDVYRIGQRLDFGRLLSFYYSGPGFYFNNACTVFAMFVFLYLQLWSHTLQLDAGVPAADLLNAQWVLQLGLLLTVPILCYLAVEHGVAHSISKFIETFVTGSPFFFMFHMGTKAHYYDSTLKYGGAKYRPTGRGFVIEHENFAELYRFHAASHLYNGFELLWGLLLLFTLGDWHLGISVYWRTFWSLWAVMVSWLFAPFWFNPLAFDGAKTSEDLKGWLLWMRRKDANPLASWEAWYNEEHEYLNTGSWLKRLHILSPGVRYALTFLGLLMSLSESDGTPGGVLMEMRTLGVIVGGVLALLLALLLLRYLLRRSYLALRVGSTFLSVALVLAVPIVLAQFSLEKIVLLLFACGYFFGALSRVLMACGQARACVYMMQAYDYLCGGCLLGLCLVLSVPQFCRQLQTKSLLSAVFERRVAHNDIMRLLGNADA